MIDPALRKLAVPIDSVQPHPRNEHHQGDVGAIVMSLRRFGQVRPIVVQKSTGYVCAGNHVWKAMKAEGEAKIAVVTPDLSDEEALAYLIADNRTPELGTTDDQGLAEILTELQAAGLLDGTGYDDEDLGRLLADLADPSEVEWSRAALALSDGEPEFTQISIVLHVDDAETVRAAITQAIEDGAESARSKSTNAVAIAHICAAYMGGDG